MSNNSTNITANKFALIYEFNGSSPLFARVASDLIDSNKLDKAIDILEGGIKLYPNYATAYFIYAKALALTGNIENAKQMVEAGNDILDDDDTLNYYLKVISEISEKSQDFVDSKRVSFFDENAEEKNETGSENFEDNLSELAEKLEGAKIELPPEDNVEPNEEEVKQSEDAGQSEEFDISSLGDGLVSQTLADIFLAQGNLKAAKAIYEKLLETEPENEAILRAKIKNIELKLKEQNPPNDDT